MWLGRNANRKGIWLRSQYVRRYLRKGGVVSYR